MKVIRPDKHGLGIKTNNIVKSAKMHPNDVGHAAIEEP